MGREVTYSAKEVIAAIKGSAGIKSTIAKKLGVSRPTIDAYLEKWETVKEAYLSEKAGIDDAAQSVVINDIVSNRSVETAKWWLRMKCSDEFRPKETQELTGKDGKELIPIAIVKPGYIEEL